MMRHLETLKRDILEQSSAGSGGVCTHLTEAERTHLDQSSVSDTCWQWKAATHAFLNRLEHCRQLFFILSKNSAWLRPLKSSILLTWRGSVHVTSALRGGSLTPASFLCDFMAASQLHSCGDKGGVLTDSRPSYDSGGAWGCNTGDFTRASYP